MAITFKLTKRKNPMNLSSDPRWYAETSKSRVCEFSEITDEATYASSATRGDVQLVMDACINSMIKHLGNGETVHLGDFGSFRMEITNVKKIWDAESETWETAAPKDKENFHASRNIDKCRIVFTPGKGLKEMIKNARYTQIP